MSNKNNGGSKKRRVEKEESSIEMTAAEDKKGSPRPISLESRKDLEASQCWDDIAEEDEMYLASTYEKLYELVMKRETFERKIKAKNSEEVIELTKYLLDYSRKNVEELQWLRLEEVNVDPRERSGVGRCTALAHFQHRRICWMFSEIQTRFLKDQRDKKKKLKVLLEENDKLRKSLEEIARERDELRDKLDSRRDAQKKDASTEVEAQEVEMQEVEMAADSVLPLSGEISRDNREALEAIVENKVAEILARNGLSGVERTRGQESSENRVGQTPKVADTWSEIVKRRRQKPPVSGGEMTPHVNKEAQTRSRIPPQPVDVTTGERSKPSGARRGRRRTRKVWPAPPSTAAVVLSAPVGKEAACVELLRRVKEELPSIEEMGIPPLRVRRARVGGLILEVPGERPHAGADSLAASLSGLAGELGVRVTRPSRKADIRVSGLEESTTETEVVTALSSLTGCPRDGFKHGRIRWSPTGVGALWIQCPIDAARKAAEGGSVKVGWVHASIEMLRTRPLRCYKCLEVGHVGVRCTSEVDRSGRCYRCGSNDHKVERCEERIPRCPLCGDKGRPHQHVLGGSGCCNDIPSLTTRGSGRRGGPSAQDERTTSSAAG